MSFAQKRRHAARTAGEPCPSRMLTMSLIWFILGVDFRIFLPLRGPGGLTSSLNEGKYSTCLPFILGLAHDEN